MDGSKLIKCLFCFDLSKCTHQFKTFWKVNKLGSYGQINEFDLFKNLNGTKTFLVKKLFLLLIIYPENFTFKNTNSLENFAFNIKQSKYSKKGHYASNYIPYCLDIYISWGKSHSRL